MRSEMTSNEFTQSSRINSSRTASMRFAKSSDKIGLAHHGQFRPQASRHIADRVPFEKILIVSKLAKAETTLKFLGAHAIPLLESFEGLIERRKPTPLVIRQTAYQFIQYAQRQFIVISHALDQLNSFGNGGHSALHFVRWY